MIKAWIELVRHSVKSGHYELPCRWYSQLPPRSIPTRPRNTPFSKLSSEDALARGLDRERFLIHRRMSRDKEMYDEDMMSMSAEVNFKLRTPRGYKHGILTKKHVNERIEVRFVWDFIKNEYGKVQSNQSCRRQGFPIGYGSYTFNVRIQIPEKGVISVDCASFMGDGYSIQDFQYFPNRMSKITEVYSGRLYRNIKPEFQQGLRFYLRERGIDDKFCKYIVAISDQRGFDEDILWASQISRFLTQK